MSDLAWVDRLAGDILTTTAELRRLVRRHHYDPPPAGQRLTTRAGAWSGIAVSAHEARTLLRASMPATMALPARRSVHADLVASMATFAGQLLDLNSVDHVAGGRAIAGAIALRASIDAWCPRMRWHEACTAVHLAWPAGVAIRTVPRQRPATDVPALFDAPPAATKTLQSRRGKKPSAGHQLSLLLPIATASHAATPTASKANRRQQRSRTRAAGGEAAGGVAA
jgi:hypothetical protein